MGKTPSTLINTEDPASPEDESAGKNNAGDVIPAATGGEQNSDQKSPESEPSPNALEGVGEPVSIYVTYKEKKNSSTTEETSDEVAEVTFTSGVDANGNAVGGDPVVFHVNPNPGWKIDAPTTTGVTATIRKEDPTTHEMISVALGASNVTGTNNYTLSPNGTSASSKAFTGDITITIVGERVKHDLVKDDNDHTMYLVDTLDENDVNPAIGTTPGLENISFNKFSEGAEIKIAIPKEEVGSKYDRLEVVIAGGTAEYFKRNEDLEKIRLSNGSEPECVIFAFKPSKMGIMVFA